jgi:hypothetical protein
MGFRWGALMSGDLSSPVKPARVRRLYCDPAILNLAISNVAEAVTVAYAALPVVTGLSAVVERGAPLVHEQFCANLLFEVQRGNRLETEVATKGPQGSLSCGSKAIDFVRELNLRDTNLAGQDAAWDRRRLPQASRRGRRLTCRRLRCDQYALYNHRQVGRNLADVEVLSPDAPFGGPWQFCWRAIF